MQLQRDQVHAIYAHLIPVIARAVKRTLPASFDSDDLAQFGQLGLLEAATTFEQYARRRIHGAMVDGVRKQWKNATLAGLPEGYDGADTASPSPLELLLEAETAADMARLDSALGACIDADSRRKAPVLEMRYRRGLSQAAAGRELGISQQAVTKREKKAVAVIRATMARAA